MKDARREEDERYLKDLKTSNGVYLLDNDTHSQFQQGHEKITRRILSVPRGSLWLPAVLVEEQLRGRLAVLAGLNPTRSADTLRVPLAYGLLLKTLHNLHDFQHLPYTADMEALYQSWPAAVKRVGTHDCRIAATAIIHGFTTEDWSI